MTRRSPRQLRKTAAAAARLVAGGGLLVLCAAPAWAGSVAPELEAALRARAPDADVAVIVTLADRVDVSRIDRGGGRSARRARLVRALRARAEAAQRPVLAALAARGATRVRPLWIDDAVAFRARADVVRDLARRPDVATVRLDATVALAEATAGVGAPSGWNVAAIRAPELWSLGHAGAGAVVATLDTGVDALHPDLAASWRGGPNGWFDPTGDHLAPHDAIGHGTQVMGLLVGGDASGTAIGVAPAARWIAAKIFDDRGVATLSGIHLGFQWLLDPDGDPDTDDVPDVVNGSWGLQGSLDACGAEFAPDLAALRLADVSVVFAAGNAGPDPATSVSPANDPRSLAVGATNEVHGVMDASSRGPSACGGLLYPGLVAPGANVRTSDLTNGGAFPGSYVQVSGTSFAAPHVSGALALLRSAFPAAPAELLEAALAETAVDLGAPGPDHDSGFGLVDVRAAHDLLASLEVPAVAADAASTLEDTAVTVDVLANDVGAGGVALAVAAVTPGAHGAVVSDGSSVTYTPNPNFGGSDSFTYVASDGRLESPPATVTVTVTAVNDPPVAADDRAATLAAVPVAVRVLANDRDVDGTLVPASVAIATGPRDGTAVPDGRGRVTYAPAAGFRGTDSFTYTVRDDRGAASAVATVTVTVR